MEDRQSASQTPVRGAWPRYDAAGLGFRHYWYPVLFSRQVGGKPRALTLCGERIVLVRDQAGRVRALHDRCPHRGVPLSQGRCAFPGMITCAYHGWTYDLASGDLVAALTDGPDSPIAGRASVRVATYPVEERGGLVWVYVGDAPAPPVEADVPAEFVAAPPASSRAPSASSAAIGATPPRTAWTRATPATCTAQHSGRCSASRRPGRASAWCPSTASTRPT